MRPMNEGNGNQPVIIQIVIPDQSIKAIAEQTADMVFERVMHRLPAIMASLNKEESIFDVKGLASYLKTTDAWIREKARAGELPSFKSGKTWKFHKRQIDKLYQSRAFLPVSTVSIKSRG